MSVEQHTVSIIPQLVNTFYVSLLVLRETSIPFWRKTLTPKPLACSKQRHENCAAAFQIASFMALHKGEQPSFGPPARCHRVVRAEERSHRPPFIRPVRAIVGKYRSWWPRGNFDPRHCW